VPLVYENHPGKSGEDAIRSPGVAGGGLAEFRQGGGRNRWGAGGRGLVDHLRRDLRARRGGKAPGGNGRRRRRAAAAAFLVLARWSFPGERVWLGELQQGQKRVEERRHCPRSE
jgi:hypothetical protein